MNSPAPPPGQHLAELEALRRDARTWHAASRSLAAPALQVETLAIPAPAFSILGEQVGLPAFYDAIQTTVANLLGQAQDVTSAMGDTLFRAADTFAQNDETGAGNLETDPPTTGGR